MPVGGKLKKAPTGSRGIGSPGCAGRSWRGHVRPLSAWYNVHAMVQLPASYSDFGIYYIREFNY